MALRAPQILNRPPRDFDFVCSQEECDSWLDANSAKIEAKKIYPLDGGKKVIAEGTSICEFEMITPGTSLEMFEKLVKEDHIDTPLGMIPSFDMLFTLKSSHKYLKNSPHFWKTMGDYHGMKMSGAKIRPEYMDFYKLREKETYTYAHPKLNQNKKHFFSDDGLQYVHDHDSIHESVKIYEHPAYTYYQKDGAEVQTSKQKFFDCSRDIRLAGVLEEAAVLAVERSLVPHPGVLTIDQAWCLAYSKVCSSITSGWFREFAYDNAPEILKLYSTYKYFDKFQAGLTSGVVKPHNPEKAY